MNATAVQRWMRANGVREVRRTSAGEFGVILTCMGPGGYGSTLADALDRARAANAEWIGWAA